MCAEKYSLFVIVIFFILQYCEFYYGSTIQLQYNTVHELYITYITSFYYSSSYETASFLVKLEGVHLHLSCLTITSVIVENHLDTSHFITSAYTGQNV